MTKEKAERQWATQNPVLVNIWNECKRGTKYASHITPFHCQYVARLGNPKAIAITQRMVALSVLHRLKM